jgi:phytol kinase
MLIVTILAVLVLLLINEYWWRWQEVHNEFSRKFVHIVVGSFVASWPFFLSWGEIQFLSLAFLIVVSLSKYFNVFQAIHSVQRPTLGEVFFAAAVGLITLITQNAWIYAAALLMMSLADGLAAVIGTRYGLRNRYSVLGHTKSWIGTTTFFVIALLILSGYSMWSGDQLFVGMLICSAILATVIENFAVEGLDNLLVPVSVALLLTNF